MSIFEYITVAVSLVLSLGVVRLLEGSLSAFQRSKLYPIHAVWILIKFNQHFTYWWFMWGLRGEVDWNYSRFILQAVPAVILYLQSTILVTATPRSIDSWRDHFYATSGVFFVLNAVYAVTFVMVTFLTLDRVPGPMPIAMTLLGVLLSLVGAGTKNPTVHAFVVIFFCVINVLTAVSIGAAPAAEL